MIDVTVYTFENKSIFKIAHNNDKSDSMLQDELYIPPTEVDDVINNGTKISVSYTHLTLPTILRV